VKISRRTLMLATAAVSLAGTQAFAQAARLNPNTATAAQLAAADGVSQAMAEQIVAGRPYATVVDFNTKLLELTNAEAAAQVLVGVFVPINLNSASREEIALIPGMSNRMIREFFEYRPYENMAEFNREIGKYVDEAEVARLRSYTTL
jgi:DNA uptake protein ComE-like DNA-binding protein